MSRVRRRHGGQCERVPAVCDCHGREIEADGDGSGVIVATCVVTDKWLKRDQIHWVECTNPAVATLYETTVDTVWRGLRRRKITRRNVPVERLCDDHTADWGDPDDPVLTEVDRNRKTYHHYSYDTVETTVG